MGKYITRSGYEYKKANLAIGPEGQLYAEDVNPIPAEIKGVATPTGVELDSTYAIHTALSKAVKTGVINLIGTSGTNYATTVIGENIPEDYLFPGSFSDTNTGNVTITLGTTTYPLKDLNGNEIEAGGIEKDTIYYLTIRSGNVYILKEASAEVSEDVDVVRTTKGIISITNGYYVLNGLPNLYGYAAGVAKISNLPAECSFTMAVTNGVENNVYFVNVTSGNVYVSYFPSIPESDTKKSIFTTNKIKLAITDNASSIVLDNADGNMMMILIQNLEVRTATRDDAVNSANSVLIEEDTSGTAYNLFSPGEIESVEGADYRNLYNLVNIASPGSTTINEYSPRVVFVTSDSFLGSSKSDNDSHTEYYVITDRFRGGKIIQRAMDSSFGFGYRRIYSGGNWSDWTTFVYGGLSNSDRADVRTAVLGSSNETFQWFMDRIKEKLTDRIAEINNNVNDYHSDAGTTADAFSVTEAMTDTDDELTIATEQYASDLDIIENASKDVKDKLVPVLVDPQYKDKVAIKDLPAILNTEIDGSSPLALAITNFGFLPFRLSTGYDELMVLPLRTGIEEYDKYLYIYARDTMTVGGVTCYQGTWNAIDLGHSIRDAFLSHSSMSIIFEDGTLHDYVLATLNASNYESSKVTGLPINNSGFTKVLSKDVYLTDTGSIIYKYGGDYFEESASGVVSADLDGGYLAYATSAGLFVVCKDTEGYFNTDKLTCLNINDNDTHQIHTGNCRAVSVNSSYGIDVLTENGILSYGDNISVLAFDASSGKYNMTSVNTGSSGILWENPTEYVDSSNRYIKRSYNRMKIGMDVRTINEFISKFMNRITIGTDDGVDTLSETYHTYTDTLYTISTPGILESVVLNSIENYYDNTENISPAILTGGYTEADNSYVWADSLTGMIRFLDKANLTIKNIGITDSTYLLSCVSDTGSVINAVIDATNETLVNAKCVSGARILIDDGNVYKLFPERYMAKNSKGIKTFSNGKDIYLFETKTGIETILLDISGSWYIAVVRRNGGLALIANKSDITLPTDVTADDIVQVALSGTGANDYMLVTKSGDLWAMGTNFFNKYASSITGSDTEWTKVTSNVKYMKNDKSINFFVIKDNGDVYGSGYNANGQLGIGNTNTVTDLTLVEGVKNPGNIVMGYNFTVFCNFRDDNGLYYFTGKNVNKASGIESLETDEIVTTPEANFMDYVHMSSYNNSLICSTSAGTILGVGNTTGYTENSGQADNWVRLLSVEKGVKGLFKSSYLDYDNNYVSQYETDTIEFMDTRSECGIISGRGYIFSDQRMHSNILPTEDDITII